MKIISGIFSQNFVFSSSQKFVCDTEIVIRLVTMFCSSCKRIDIIRECQRKICPVGHILCENCDENLKICPEPNCLLKISSYACVSRNVVKGM